MTAHPSPRAVVGLLLVLTLAAGLLRLRHIDFGLPESAEPDCRIPFQVENLRRSGDWPRSDKELTWYPLVIARTAALLPEPPPVPAGASLAEHIAAAARPYAQVRAAGALLGLLAVPLTWLLARRFLTPSWSLVAAAFVAVSMLHVGFSQQSRPHAASAGMYLLPMLACLHLRRSVRLHAWLLCGFALALAIGTLHSGVALFLPLAMVWFLGARAGGRWLELRLLIPLAVVALSLPVSYPFWFSTQSAGVDVQGSVVKLAAHPVYLSDFNGAGFRIMLRTFWYYEPALLVACVLALAWLVRDRALPGTVRDAERRRDLWVVLAFVLPYSLVTGVYLHVYERFALPLVPYAACLASWGLARTSRALTRGLGTVAARTVPCGLALAALALPAYASWRLVAVRGQPTTNQQAAAWLTTHLQPGDARILLSPPLDLPLARTTEGLLVNGQPPPARSKYYWARYQYGLDPGRRPLPAWDLRWLQVAGATYLERLERDPLGVLADDGADLAVVEVFAPGRNLPAATRMLEELRRKRPLLVRFTPDARADYSEHPFGYEDMTHVKAENFLLRLLQAERTGPVIEVFDLRRGAGGH